MRILIQPNDGISALIKGVDKAKKSVEVVIFRFDRLEMERALENAVKRGVHVRALIAYTNRGGEKNLRSLEMRLLAAGVTVARTSDDLARYHGKMMIVDRKEVYVLAFNLTRLDIERSRSFGIITSNRSLVQEAAKLFQCDSMRQSYVPGCNRFLVSPANARKELTSFIKGAKNELLIYDMRISDQTIIGLLEERIRAGVQVRIIGKLTRKSNRLEIRKLNGMRLHTRTIVRDGRQLFLGSQSLRELELDGRREIGIIVPDRKIIAAVAQTFEEDWMAAGLTRPEEIKADTPAVTTVKSAKKVAKSIAKELTPQGSQIDRVLKRVTQGGTAIELSSNEVQTAVKQAVKDAVKEVVQAVMTEESAKQDST